jgi:exodeoxyribonuclease VII large subunit
MQTSLFSATSELQLTELRATIARELKVEPGKVWSGKAMLEILNAQPKSESDLARIKGLPKKKAQAYGFRIIRVFNPEAEMSPAVSTKNEKPKAAFTEEADSYEKESAITEKVLGVGDYLDYINHILKVAGDIKVIGEISRLSNHPTGVYMTLKDKEGDGVLDCYINPYTYRGLGLVLEEGMEVKAFGTPGIFKRRSQLSLKVEGLELAGEGTLKKAYDLLKQKLEQEGIFDRKRELPEFISAIGIITSKTGAVIDDFRNNLEKLGSKIYLKDCRVEGNQAAGQIINAIKYFNISQPDLDCLVVMRGGGSLEDMQAFNSEAVIKEVFASRIPVIAALGHDRDVPLTCLAADVYTSTPTAAAVLINGTWQRLKRDTPKLEQLLVHRFQNLLNGTDSALNGFIHQLTGSFNSVLQKFRHLEEKVIKGFGQILSSIATAKQRADSIMSQSIMEAGNAISKAGNAVASAEKLLAAASPERNLKLGYSLSYAADGKLVRSVNQTSKGDALRIRLSDGDINTEII